MKFRLCKNEENKYNHQFVELKNYLKSTFLVNSIIGIIVGFSLISIKFPNEFKNLVVNFKYAISVYFSGYANLSNEDKNLCVSNAYLRIVNNSSKFSEEVKEELVEVSYFLKDYGYLYEADDLINLEKRLSTVQCQKMEVEKDGNVDTVAKYNFDDNIISFSNIESFPHEVSHLIVGSSNYFYNDFVRESITSSIEVIRELELKSIL